MEIEDRVKQIMKSRGITIKQMARDIGVSHTTLGKNFNFINSMSLRTLQKISIYLSIEWFDVDIDESKKLRAMLSNSKGVIKLVKEY